MAKKDTLQKVDNSKLEKVTGGTYIPANAGFKPTTQAEYDELFSHGGSAYNYQKNKAAKNGNLSLC